MFLYCLQRSSFNGESSRRSRLPTSPSAAAVAPIPDCSVRRALHIRFSSFPNPHVYKQETHTEGKKKEKRSSSRKFPVSRMRCCLPYPPSYPASPPLPGLQPKSITRRTESRKETNEEARKKKLYAHTERLRDVVCII